MKKSLKMLLFVVLVLLTCTYTACGKKEETNVTDDVIEESYIEDDIIEDSSSEKYSAERYIVLYSEIMDDYYQNDEISVLCVKTLKSFYDNAPVDGIEAERYWANVLIEIDTKLISEGYTDLYGFRVLTSEDIDWYVD